MDAFDQEAKTLLTDDGTRSWAQVEADVASALRKHAQGVKTIGGLLGALVAFCSAHISEPFLWSVEARDSKVAVIRLYLSSKTLRMEGPARTFSWVGKISLLDWIYSDFPLERFVLSGLWVLQAEVGMEPNTRFPLEVAAASMLDRLAEKAGLARKEGETDSDLRARMRATRGKL